MKPFIAWTVAIIITIAAVIFQRGTGPTKPQEIPFLIPGQTNETVMECPRSLTRNPDGGLSTIDVKIKEKNFDADQISTVSIVYKRYPSTDASTKLSAQKEIIDGVFHIRGEVPTQPAAGKVEYSIVLTFLDGSLYNSESVILRFRNDVPALVIIPHILFMYLALLLAIVTGLNVFRENKAHKFATATLIAFFIGGFILGPLLQHYAFGVYWSGWPLGGDLTDNKTLFAFIVWLIAWIPNLFRKFRTRKYAKYLYLVAALVTLAIYTIPHSARGSEYDYEKGEVATEKRPTTELQL